MDRSMLQNDWNPQHNTIFDLIVCWTILLSLRCSLVRLQHDTFPQKCASFFDKVVVLECRFARLQDLARTHSEMSFWWRERLATTDFLLSNGRCPIAFRLDLVSS